MTPAGVLVDDHILLRVLLEQEPPELRPRGGPMSTTGLWYHRLCRALSDSTVTGTLSRALGAVSSDVATETIRSVVTLPEWIQLTSLRTLGWPMATTLAAGDRLNLLSLEALSAASHLGAEICLAAVDDNPPLQDAARRKGIPVRVLG